MWTTTYPTSSMQKRISLWYASATAEVIMGIVLDLGWEIDATTAQLCT